MLPTGRVFYMPIIEYNKRGNTRSLKRNTEARTSNHYCHGKPILIPYSERVSCVVSSVLPYFFTVPRKWHGLREKVSG